MQELKLTSPSENASLRLGARFGRQLESGDVVTLQGELGSGKTVFARGIARGLGVPHTVPITSPTFTLINEYEGRLRLYHLDLYRLTSPAELEMLPWREIIFGEGVSVIEWPDRMAGLLPEERWDIGFAFLGDDRRSIRLAAHGKSQEARLANLAQELTEISRFEACP